MSKHGRGGSQQRPVIQGGGPREVRLTPQQLQSLINDGNGLVLRPEEAENKRRVEEVNRAQATLNELGAMQEHEKNLFGMMVSATLTRRDVTPEDLAQFKIRAGELNTEYQRQRWQQVRDTLADLGIKVLGKEQSHMVWAASKFGVALVPPEPVKLEAVPEPEPVDPATPAE